MINQFPWLVPVRNQKLNFESPYLTNTNSTLAHRPKVVHNKGVDLSTLQLAPPFNQDAMLIQST